MTESTKKITIPSVLDVEKTCKVIQNETLRFYLSQKICQKNNLSLIRPALWTVSCSSTESHTPSMTGTLLDIYPFHDRQLDIPFIAGTVTC